MDLLVDYDFIAIFDADFKPEPDFLVRPFTCQLHLHAWEPPCPVNQEIIVRFTSACVQAHLLVKGVSASPVS